MQLIQDLQRRLAGLERDQVKALHTHNGSDSNKIKHADAADVNNVGDMPIATFRISGGQTLGGGRASYPAPIIFGHGVGVYSQFDGGLAPEGTLVFFENAGVAHQMWLNIGGTDWRGVELGLTA